MQSVGATEVRYLEGRQIQVLKPEGAAQLRIIIDQDRCVLNGQIRRLFPLSRPNEFFSVQDEDGKEVGVLRTLEELPHDSRKLVEQDLDRRYFTPKILQIRSLKQEGGMWTFEVNTSRGESKFYVRNWRDSSYEIAPGRFVIMSVDGQRYEIEHLDQLDAKSQVFIEQLF